VVTCLANSPTAQNFVKLRSYHPPTATDESTFPNFTIWEAARATSAAPAYFERLKVKDELTGNEHHFIDGGMVYNNPTPL
jgi:patatin-like phospholipase/acyl hydrolase